MDPTYYQDIAKRYYLIAQLASARSVASLWREPLAMLHFSNPYIDSWPLYYLEQTLENVENVNYKFDSESLLWSEKMVKHKSGVWVRNKHAKRSILLFPGTGWIWMDRHQFFFNYFLIYALSRAMDAEIFVVTCRSHARFAKKDSLNAMGVWSRERESENLQVWGFSSGCWILAQVQDELTQHMQDYNNDTTIYLIEPELYTGQTITRSSLDFALSYASMPSFPLINHAKEAYFTDHSDWDGEWKRYDFTNSNNLTVVLRSKYTFIREECDNLTKDPNNNVRVDIVNLIYHNNWIMPASEVAIRKWRKEKL